MVGTQLYIITQIVHTTTCFGPVYWPLSGCTVNLISSYTICTWGTLGGTRSRLTVVGGMASGSSWTGVNPLNPELNPICYLLALLAHHFLHVSRIRVKSLTLR